MPPEPFNGLDMVLNQTTTTNSPAAVNYALRNSIHKIFTGDDLVDHAGGRPGPVERIGYERKHVGGAVHHVRRRTLFLRFSLTLHTARSARFGTAGIVPSPRTLVQQFCRTFIPGQARLASDRSKSVSSLATKHNV